MTTEKKIYYTLRIASGMCLIGHGVFGIITKTVWCNYFAVVGIDQLMAYRLMPIIGFIDILMGLILLIYPVKPILIWLVIWGVITASLRPLSGEPFAEFLERAGNFGAPLTLLVLCDGENGFSRWDKKLEIPLKLSPESLKRVILFLKITAAILLIGHGWLNLLEKKGLLAQYSVLGFKNLQLTATIAGVIEIAGAVIILIKPLRPVILFFLVWKISSELLYPQWEVFEWVERGASYGTLLALYFALKPNKSLRD
ncbi:hypothetical protein [Pedobacter sp. UYP24]